MKALVFWILMFGLLGLFIYLTLISNPQRPMNQRAAIQSEPTPIAEKKTWKKVYAELYGPDGLEKTWEIATPKGYFDGHDREEFLRKIPAEGRFGEAEITVKEDGGDLIFGIYYKGAKP